MSSGTTAQGNDAAVQIFGFELGAAYQDALAAAGASFQLRENGPESHQGRGTLDGMQASLYLAGRGGRLVDIHLQLTLGAADAGMRGSKPLARLTADLGAPAEQSDDVARWRPAGHEVTLQRTSTYARGEDAPRIEYSIRGRQSAARTRGHGGAEPGEEEAKEREAEQGAP